MKKTNKNNWKYSYGNNKEAGGGNQDWGSDNFHLADSL